MIISGALEITVKVGCPNWCSCCPQNTLAQAYGNKRKILLYDHFKIIVDRLPPGVRIDFSGFCEPFIHPDIVYMIKYALRNHQVVIYSTLVGLTDQKAKLLSLFKKQLPPIEVHRPDAYFILDENRHKRGLNLLGKYNIPFRIASFGLHSRAGSVNPDVCKPIHHVGGKVTCGICGPIFNRNVLLPNGEIVTCCQDYSLQNCLGNLLWESWDYIHSDKNPQYIKLQKMCQANDNELICRKCNFVSRGIS